MPEQSKRVRWFLWGAIGALAFIVVILSIVGFRLRGQVQEQVRDERVAEVATCFATARSRPALAVILRLVATTAKDSDDRRIVNEAITYWTGGAPSLAQCKVLARVNGLDPDDFPPPTARGR